MLDTHARKFVQPVIQKAASFFVQRGWRPNQITGCAFMIGVLASLSIGLGQPLLGVALLWISGFLDAVDGSMARLRGNASAWGTVLDVTLDRLVEAGVIIALAVLHPQPEVLFLLLLLVISFLFSMTVFLTVGAVSGKRGEKSFYYQAGLAERTEGFIFLTLMVLFQGQLLFWGALFCFAVVVTALQRLAEARRLLR
ncbi:MAG: CDP-alcohol phosphatidyltransferase [Bacillus thermozeamaize]|uniref:CDP-alcohol phosphatidyltransferase n=1 Tax=Bacillus thermozeamaize TaxID=230954 RepID=A0A1Y3PFH7_9BACI|nr:MAG: CDP-alcohol phosphatidyltransferase [Bacillus thermozeamaize]